MSTGLGADEQPHCCGFAPSLPSLVLGRVRQDLHIEALRDDGADSGPAAAFFPAAFRVPDPAPLPERPRRMPVRNYLMEEEPFLTPMLWERTEPYPQPTAVPSAYTAARTGALCETHPVDSALYCGDGNATPASGSKPQPQPEPDPQPQPQPQASEPEPEPEPESRAPKPEPEPEPEPEPQPEPVPQPEPEPQPEAQMPAGSAAATAATLQAALVAIASALSRGEGTISFNEGLQSLV